MEESKKDRVNQEQIEQVRRVNAEIKELLKSFP
jgi:hypothetical protein